MPFWERKQTIKILWQISPPPRILTLTTYTHTGKANRPPVHNCTGLSVQSLHTEWWLPLSPAFVRLLWEEQFTESIIDFCHNRYRDASPFPLSQLALRIATVRPVCEVPSLFFFKEIHHKVWGMGGRGGEESDENKIIFTLPYRRMFTSSPGNEHEHHGTAEK